MTLEGLRDANLGGCLDSGESASRFVFTIGGTTNSWMSRLHKTVEMSTRDAGYKVIAEASKERFG